MTVRSTEELFVELIDLRVLMALTLRHDLVFLVESFCTLCADIDIHKLLSRNLRLTATANASAGATHDLNEGILRSRTVFDRIKQLSRCSCTVGNSYADVLTTEGELGFLNVSINATNCLVLELRQILLFEDISNLFAENGISLTLDGFTWDPARINPFRKSQLYSSGQQGVI